MTWDYTVQGMNYFSAFIMVDFLLYIYMHLYCIALHYDALLSTVHSAAFHIVQHQILGWCLQNLTQYTTQPHGDKTPHHPPTPQQQSRATHFNNCGDDRLFCFEMHTLTQALCVCIAHCLLQTEDFWLGVCQ